MANCLPCILQAPTSLDQSCRAQWSLGGGATAPGPDLMPCLHTSDWHLGL